MGIEEITLEPERIKDINRLLRDSFNPNFLGIKPIVRGNRTLVDENYSRDNFCKINQLFYITKGCFLWESLIGQFLEPDGSSLIMYPDYKKEGERFSKLYKEHFERDTSINYKKVKLPVPSKYYNSILLENHLRRINIFD